MGCGGGLCGDRNRVPVHTWRLPQPPASAAVPVLHDVCINVPPGTKTAVSLLQGTNDPPSDLAGYTIAAVTGGRWVTKDDTPVAEGTAGALRHVPSRVGGPDLRCGATCLEMGRHG